LKKEKGKKVSIETRIEILCEAFPDFRKAGVHPAADKGDRMSRIGAVEVQDLEASRTHIAGDGDVLDHMIPDGFMAFDLFVGGPTEEDKLAVGGPEAAKGSFGPVGQIEQDEEMDKGNDESLAPAQGFQIRPKGKEVRLLFVREMDGLGEGDVGKAGVGIDEEQIVAFCLLGELMARPRFTHPALREWLTGNQSDPGVPFGSLLNKGGCSIG